MEVTKNVFLNYEELQDAISQYLADKGCKKVKNIEVMGHKENGTFIVTGATAEILEEN